MKLIDRIMREPVQIAFGRGGGGRALDVAPEADHVQIGASGLLSLFPAANPVNAGVMTAADKVKLDGIPEGGGALPPPPPSEYETVAQFSGASIEPSVNLIRVGGYHLSGDGGAALYVRAASQPAHGGRVQSADGAWWELADDRVRPEMYGAVGDGVTDDSAAMMAMADHARARGFLDAVLAGSKIYCYTVPQFLCSIPRVVIDGNGAGFRNISGGDTDTNFLENYVGLAFNSAFMTQGPAWYNGSLTPFVFGQLIETVAAGSFTVTVAASEGSPDVSVGDRVLVYGFDAQSSASFPPNARFFEYATVTAVSGTDVTLDAPLAYSYDADWTEDLGASLYGKPRLLSLHRSDFREIDFLHLKDLRILTNPAWTAPGATAERNGRMTVAGCRHGLLENVEVAGGCYPSQAESLHFLGGRVGVTTETDKVIGKIRFENWRCAKHALGTGARTMEFVNCRITDGFNASPQDSLVIDGGELRGKAEGSSSALLALNHRTRRIALKGGARFHVDEVSRISFTTQVNKSVTVDVVDAQTVDMALASYTASQISRAITVGGRLYDADGAPAMRVTRMPYLSGGRVRIEGFFLKDLANGDTLYAGLFEELDIRGGIFDGPYGHQIRATGLTSQTLPIPNRMLSERHGEGFWIFNSDDIDPGMQTARFFAPGHRVSVARVVIDVVKPYTGLDTYAQVQLRDWPGPNPNPWATVNLKLAGRRVLDVGGVSGALSNDTLNGIGSDPVALFNVQGAPGGSVTDAAEAAVWNIRIEGSQI